MKKLFLSITILFLIGFFGFNAYAYEAESYDGVVAASLIELSTQEEMIVPVFPNFNPMASQPRQIIRPFSEGWLQIIRSESSNVFGSYIRSDVTSFNMGRNHSVRAFLRLNPILCVNQEIVPETIRESPVAFNSVRAISGSHGGIVWASGDVRLR